MVTDAAPVLAGAEPFDLLVVGGGVNGAGIARDAAGRGLSVMLCEKDDLAEGTSSRSGKLIHGGLRYLEYYEFRLVREALIEREILLANAPHIIWPLRFVLPHDARQRPAWLIRLGLFLYDRLGGRRRLPGCRTLDLRTAPEGRPLQDGFRRGFEYSDCWVEDARLVVLNALDASERGARILTRTPLVSARREGRLWRAVLRDRRDGGERVVRARCLVNAAGPWVDTVLGNRLGVNSAKRLRLVRGSHLITRRLYDGPQAYLIQNDDRRVIFVNPYEDDFNLIGTTDIPQEAGPDEVAITPEEERYLCAVVNRVFRRRLEPDDIVHRFSGVRPLFDDAEENPSAVTRDYAFELDGGGDRAPVLSVFGGKITTYRKLSEHALDRLRSHFPQLRPAWTERAPLPGGDLPEADFEAFHDGLRRRYHWLPTALARRYARTYGTRCEQLLAGAGGVGDLGRDLGAGLHERELQYLIGHEWAETADDILWRRTRLGLRLDTTQRAALEDWLAARRPGAVADLA